MRSGLYKFSEIEMFWIWDVFGLAYMSVRSGNVGDELDKNLFDWGQVICDEYPDHLHHAVAHQWHLKKSLEVAQGIVTANLIRIWKLFKIACSRVDLVCFDVLSGSKRQHEQASDLHLEHLIPDLETDPWLENVWNFSVNLKVQTVWKVSL